MPYYDTIDDDVKRAKAILARGQPARIYGEDSYASYKLLESFVAEIERLRTLITAVGGETVCTTALRLQEKLRTRNDDAG